MISIITIVKNDLKIENLLSVFFKSVEPDLAFEYIVVDASLGKLDSIKKNYSKEVRWLDFVPKNNNKSSIPEQRNYGVENAKGQVLVFIDSDCTPAKGWLKALTQPILKENENIVAGKVSLSDTNSLHAIEFEKNKGKTYIDEAPTMNIAITKKVFDAVGLFDKTFQCGEDVDLLWRAVNKGYKIRYAQEAAIYHDLESFQKEIKRMYVYGKARVRLYRKNTFRLKFFWGNEFLAILYPLYVMAAPLSFWYPQYLLVFAFFVLNYRSESPFKLFALKTIYGLGVLTEFTFGRFFAYGK